MYEKIKRLDEDFISIGSAEDERLIKEMNEKGIDSFKNKSVKEEDKEEEGTKKRKSGHVKMIARKKPRKLSDDDSDDEHRKCLKIVTFEATIDSEINGERKSGSARLNKVLHQMEIILLYTETNGGLSGHFILLSHGEDLKIMMDPQQKERTSDFWSNQQDWKIVTWRLYESCRVCILEFEDGIVIHILVERRYPLSKDLLQRMLDLGLEVERGLCARARSVDDMPFRTRACMGYTRWVFCKPCGRPKVIRGGETVSNSIFKHDLCKLIIAKMGFANTYDSTEGTESGEERFKKFANNSGIVAKRKIKGKAIMKEAKPVQKKTKLQLEQERLGLEEALRLQEQLDKEERQRIAKVHEEASTFNAEEWDNIQAQIEADEELAHSPKRRKIGEGSEPAEESKDELSQEQLQHLMIIVPEEGMNVELKRLFEPDDDDTLWKLQRGYDIFMLVEKDYPLTRALMTLMLCNKLQVDEYSVMADKKFDTLKQESSERYKKNISEIVDLENAKKKLENIVFKVGQSTQTMHTLTKPQNFYDETHKTALGYQNPLYLSQVQRKQPALYSGHVLIAKEHNPVAVCDSEEILILAEKSRTTLLVFYTKVFPKKLPPTSQVLKNLNNARDLLTKFDEFIKRRTTLSPYKIGSWEQSNIKVDNYGKCKSLDIVLLDLQESNKSLSELRKRFEKLEEYIITLDIAFQNHKEQMILNNPAKNKQLLVKTINNQSVEINDLKVIKKIEDENMSLDFQVSSLVKERKHIKLEYKKLYDSIKQTWAKTKLQTDSLQQKLNYQGSKNNKLRAQLKGKFSESQTNHRGTSVNTKLSKPSTSGTKLYFVTLFPKSKVIPKVVEKNDLSKSVSSHLTTNKIIEKYTKVLAPGLLKIESELINAYFKNNRAVHHDYLRVTKEHELLVYVSASCRFTQSGNEKWAPVTSHKKNNKPYVDASRMKQTIETITKVHAVKQNTCKTDNTMLPSTGRVSFTTASGSKPRSNIKNDRIPQSSSRSMKNKVEAHHRKFKSSVNKNNHVSDCNANVKNVALSKNSNTICLSCNEYLFSANHDACVVQYL
ncbi:hypothetical protein Tco_0058950 [Tanacetum coccineum]